jgi:hypothetical protein
MASASAMASGSIAAVDEPGIMAALRFKVCACFRKP